MHDVARAGQRLKDVIPWDDYDDEVRRVFSVANSWRDSHVLPMKSIRLSIAHRMRHLKLSGDVVARAKRMSSIRGKLRRHPGKLDQMQDLGGCRAIMDVWRDNLGEKLRRSRVLPHIWCRSPFAKEFARRCLSIGPAAFLEFLS